jgi:enamine deaminase RidA (YjgF/YER057c/UK114 family)
MRAEFVCRGGDAAALVVTSAESNVERCCHHSRELIVRSHNPPTVWTPPEQFRTIYTHALEVPIASRQLYVSGQFGVAPEGAMRPDFPEQLDQAMSNVEALLSAAGMGKSQIVKTTFFLTRTEDLPMLGEARRRRWGSDMPAAVTVIVVAGLARADALVEVEVFAAAVEP